MSDIDWSKPIEAVEEDGKAYLASAKKGNQDEWWTVSWHNGSIGRQHIFSESGQSNIDAPDFIRNRTEQPASTDTVTIARMTYQEARERWDGSGLDRVAVLKELGIVKPDPTPAERMAADLNFTVEDAQRALDWKEANQ